MKRLTSRLAFGTITGIIALCGVGVIGERPAQAAEAASLLQEKDIIVFNDGSTLEGEILEETERSVRIRVTIAGLSAEQTYQKSNIMSIKRAEREAAPKEPEPEAPARAPAERPALALATPDASGAGARVYVINLTGEFGRDISQSPMRRAVQDARKQNATHIIFVMNNDWSRFEGLEQIPEDEGAFQQIFRAEEIDPVITEDIPRLWEGEDPTVVFWIKQAMGGAAFLPFNCRNIYFHSEGRMGGLGNLLFLDGQRGSQVTRDKLLSARLGHARSMANYGGYDERIVRAMSQIDYVLSYRMEGGKAVLLERMPQSADEILLTDNGLENPDSIENRARSRGNDVLTLKAEVARDLGVSKGTVDTLDDLLFELGVARDHAIVSDRSDRIMATWREGLRRSMREFRELREELDRIQVQGRTARERNRQRGAQISTLKRMIRILMQYEEALPGADGLRGQLETRIAQIKLQMAADRD